MYATRIIADRLPIDIVEVSSSEEERTLRVTRGRDITWEINLTRWYPPSVGLLPNGSLAVWASTRLFLLVTGHAPHRMDLDDEVHAVFLVDDQLLVVTELSVLLYEPTTGALGDRFDADDVLGGARWQGDELLIEQQGGHPLRFRPRNGALSGESSEP